MLPHEDEEVGRVHSRVDTHFREERRERREKIATAVLAGLAAWPGDTQNAIGHVSRAKLAVNQADALIAELDK